MSGVAREERERESERERERAKKRATEEREGKVALEGGRERERVTRERERKKNSSPTFSTPNPIQFFPFYLGDSFCAKQTTAKSKKIQKKRRREQR